MISSRSASQGNPPAPPQSVEAVRRRARHRLIGASVLVLLGVIGFPLLFDTQPRPIAVDIPIDIPSRQAPAAPAKAAPAPEAKPAEQAAPEPTRAAPLPMITEEKSAEKVAEKPEPKSEPKSEPKPEPKPEAKAPAQAEAKPEPKPEPKPHSEPKPAAPSEAARAAALLEGKTPAAATAAQRVVVQVGAFADEARAREVRQKLERAGLKTYTHVAQTAEGRRIRVRLGPYDSRAEAEKIAARVKSLGLSAAILTL
ncbi:SPOR domain-containing protein [Hydrogenophaga sp.]|uniref:SPOR domain-containing protein n=1 Tax=Hydrogenophaga sp. TaxID=1904254 RepID=UPI00391B386E